MIDTLRTLAQPYSHWLMAHRDTTIVVMGIFLMWTTGQALLSYWRLGRMSRDRSADSTDSRSVVRRTYAPAGVPAGKAAAAEPEPTGLPPVRGGRTYARNLGNALQKAGMAPPAAPVYSPPAPVGWGPGPAPTPGRPAQPTPPPYAAPSPPWASPAQSGPPSGPRPMPGPPAATPWPTYVPPSSPGQPAAQPGPPYYGGAPAQPGPAIGQPGSQPFPFQMPTAPSSPGGPPQFAGVPLSEPVPPPLPTYTAPAQAISPAPPEAAPAKPKRKRFSLQVLQNLEKTLQRTTGASPSTPVAEPAPSPAPQAPASMPAVASAASPVAPAPSAPPSAPPAQAAAIEEPQVGAAEEEPPAEAAHEEATAAQEPEPATWEATEPPSWKEQEVAPAAEAEPAVSDTRAAMRAMLFGEDERVQRATQKPAPAEEPAPAAEEEVFRFEPVTAEPVAEGEASGEEPTPSAEPAALAEASEAPSDSAEPAVSPWETESPAEVAPSESAVLAGNAPTHDADTYGLFDQGATAEPATAAADAGPAGSEPAPSGGDRGKLVIIEDDAAVAEYYATLFRGNGWDVRLASDGISGVDLCIREQPNVILLDVMMPRQNGMLVLQTLRASDETKDTPVVVLSNFSEPTLIKRALQLGALEYVIKTQVEGPALLEALPRWINREKVFAAA